MRRTMMPGEEMGAIGFDTRRPGRKIDSAKVQGDPEEQMVRESQSGLALEGDDAMSLYTCHQDMCWQSLVLRN